MSYQIKVDSRLYLVEGVVTARIGSYIKYLALGKKIIRDYSLTVSSPNIKITDELSYFRIQSDYPIIVHISGKGELTTDFMEMSVVCRAIQMITTVFLEKNRSGLRIIISISNNNHVRISQFLNCL